MRQIIKEPMSFVKKIFNSKRNPKEIKKTYISWIPLTSLSQLEEIKQQSNSEVIAVFKHSTRCGISRMVLKQFENSFSEEMKNFKIYYLDLLRYRVVSDEVAATFQIVHQSPQLLVIKSGKAITYASHSNISKIELEEYI